MSGKSELSENKVVRKHFSGRAQSAARSLTQTRLLFQKSRNGIGRQRVGKFAGMRVVSVDRELARPITRQHRQEIKVRHVNASPEVVQLLVNSAELILRTEQM